MMKIHKGELTNGIRTIIAPMESTETVTVQAMIRSGSRREKADNKGIAHFSEHIFFKGTSRRPNTLAISSFIENRGGEFNAFTDKEYTGFYTKLPAEHIEAGMDFVSDLITDPLLDPKEIEKEKGVIVEEINMYEDTPQQNVAEVIDETAWGDTPLGWSVAGTKETVQSFKQADFKQFIDANYFGQNMIVAVAGKTNTATEDLIAEYFSHFPKDGRAEVQPAKILTGPVVRNKVKKTEQTHFVVGLSGLPVKDNRRQILKVLTNIIGGGMGSRMFIEIREQQGLCYYIYACNVSLSDTGLLQIHAGVDIKRSQAALESVILELNKIKSSDIKEEELKRAKEISKGRLLLRLEDSEEVANFYTKQALYNLPSKTPQQVIAEIESVTMKEVRDMAHELIQNSRLHIAQIGPKKLDLVKLK